VRKKRWPSFSNSVIQAGCSVKSIYRLLLRSLQGFLDSILKIINVNLKSQRYTLFFKRAKESADCLPKLSNKKPSVPVIDSSGLKILSKLIRFFLRIKFFKAQPYKLLKLKFNVF
jgi:hypothetical protein